MRENRLAHIAFLVLLGLCWLPMLLQIWPDESLPDNKLFRTLQGYQASKDLPAFSLTTWFKSEQGEFQNKLESGLIEHLQIRPGLVRLNNQLKFNLSGRINAKYVVYGEEGYFYSRRDIDAYQGRNVMGDKKIHRLMRRLNCVRDTLKRTGTEVLFVIAPSKVRYIPDYIPPPFTKRGPKGGNRKAFLKWLTHYDLPHLEYGSYLEEIKPEADYPVYARGGYHWTAYGVYLAADTLLRQIQDLTAQPMPQLKLTGLDKRLNPMIRDNDIGDAANLLYQSFQDTLAYPQVEAKWPKGEPEQKARVLTVGDSYYTDVVSLGLPEAAFAPDWEFWYYNNLIRTQGNNNTGKVKDIPSLTEELASWDVILIVITELNLPNGSWSFIDKAFDAYFSEEFPCGLRDEE